MSDVNDSHVSNQAPNSEFSIVTELLQHEPSVLLESLDLVALGRTRGASKSINTLHKELKPDVYLEKRHLPLRQIRKIAKTWTIKGLRLGPRLVRVDALLKAFPRVERLHCNGITDLTPLGSCKELTHLMLEDCGGITDLAPLGSCGQLTHLKLKTCLGITDLAPLGSCKQLTQLVLYRCGGITDLAPLGLDQLAFMG